LNDDSSIEDSVLFATGGKENELKLWNLNKLDIKSDGQAMPLFKAKNLPDNSMQLREPVWITCIDFIDSSRIVTGTAYHQVNIHLFKPLDLNVFLICFEF
jgi:ribosome biogenesis protein NSA1